MSTKDRIVLFNYHRYSLSLPPHSLLKDRAYAMLKHLILPEVFLNLAEAAACVDAEGAVNYAELDAAYHLLLCEFSQNRPIVEIMKRNRDKVSRVMLRVLRRDKGRLRASYIDHVGIVEAVIVGDGILASTRVRNHLEYGKHILIT